MLSLAITHQVKLGNRRPIDLPLSILRPDMVIAEAVDNGLCNLSVYKSDLLLIHNHVHPWKLGHTRLLLEAAAAE